MYNIFKLYLVAQSGVKWHDLGSLQSFPHGTGTLSVSWEYLALPDGPGRFTQDYTCPALLRILLCLGMLRIKGFHLLWLNFPEYSSRNSSTTT